jgi:hypothetical protein
VRPLYARRRIARWVVVTVLLAAATSLTITEPGTAAAVVLTLISVVLLVVAVVSVAWQTYAWRSPAPSRRASGPATRSTSS